MKKFEIKYLSYADRVVTTTVEAINKEEAINGAYADEGNYSSDNIFKIISVDEI